MSVLIDGIKLPKNENIYITLMPQGTVVTAEKGSYYSRPKVKEIPEQHGRLIDADALMKQIQETCKRLYGTDDINAASPTLSAFNRYIGEAPTIIEAEE